MPTLKLSQCRTSRSRAHFASGDATPRRATSRPPRPCHARPKAAAVLIDRGWNSALRRKPASRESRCGHARRRRRQHASEWVPAVSGMRNGRLRPVLDRQARMTEFIRRHPHHRLPSPFPMRRAARCTRARRLRNLGELDAARGNAVLIVTACRPTRTRPPTPPTPIGMVGADAGSGQAVDTDRWFVICVNSLGSCKVRRAGVHQSGDGGATVSSFPTCPSKTAPTPPCTWCARSHRAPGLRDRQLDGGRPHWRCGPSRGSRAVTSTSPARPARCVLDRHPLLAARAIRLDRTGTAAATTTRAIRVGHAHGAQAGRVTYRSRWNGTAVSAASGSDSDRAEDDRSAGVRGRELRRATHAASAPGRPDCYLI